MADHSFETTYRGYKAPSDRLHTPGLLEGFAAGVDAVLSADHVGNSAEPEATFTYWMDNDRVGYRWFWRHRTGTDSVQWADEAGSESLWRESRRVTRELDGQSGVTRVFADQVPLSVRNAEDSLDD